MDHEGFAELASPHCWLMVADNLHEQAVSLYRKRGHGLIIRTSRRGPEARRDSINRSVFLLAGFALEKALKAFLIYENPEWVSNGKLSRRIRTHSLSDLQRCSKLVPYKKRYRWVLEEFEDGLESWARYPVCARRRKIAGRSSSRGEHLGCIPSLDESLWKTSSRPTVRGMVGAPRML
jgi:hypothetical protein